MLKLQWRSERQVRVLVRRKIVFVIVEGPSDRTALELLLNHIFDRDEVYVHVTYGDITSRSGANSSNILKKVAEEVKVYSDRYRLKRSDFQQVIHILDMDGAYIPDDLVVYDSEAEKPIYSLDSVKTSNRQGIIDRNFRKRRNMDKLSETPKIWGGVPYSAHYMSCNLDHVLYNKLNSTDEEKEADSKLFSKKYKADKDGFIQFITRSDFSVGGEYRSSWKYIKEGTHSLERHTNLGLCFPEVEAANDDDTTDDIVNE